MLFWRILIMLLALCRQMSPDQQTRDDYVSRFTNLLIDMEYFAIALYGCPENALRIDRSCNPLLGRVDYARYKKMRARAKAFFGFECE